MMRRFLSGGVTATVIGPLLATSLLTSVAANAATIEEIIVTAQKREQNVQDVPVASPRFSKDL
ncbi:MAG: hypothetical protein HC809_02310, partial [Gammaproteobacteria bacterium]|nr:hypothetical protein [Gammaproteobacteria bacterium]